MSLLLTSNQMIAIIIVMNISGRKDGDTDGLDDDDDDVDVLPDYYKHDIIVIIIATIMIKGMTLLRDGCCR